MVAGFATGGVTAVVWTNVFQALLFLAAMVVHMLRVFFTGGSGKAGRYAIAHLVDQGHRVVNADLVPLGHPGVSDLHVDLTDAGQVFERALGADHHDRHVLVALVRADAMDQLEPVHDRHVDVGDDDVEALGREPLEARDAVVGFGTGALRLDPPGGAVGSRDLGSVTSGSPGRWTARTISLRTVVPD